MSIKVDLRYQILYSEMSLHKEPKLCTELKQNFNIEIPQTSGESFSSEIRDTLDSYLYLPETHELRDVYRKFPNCRFKSLGFVSGLELLDLVSTCQMVSLKNIELGAFYKVLRGSLKNLVVKIVEVDGVHIWGEYPGLFEDRRVKILVGDLERVHEYPDLLSVEQYKNFPQLFFERNLKKAMLLDVSDIMRSVSGRYKNEVGLDGKTSVGHHQGLYYSILRLKELFVEYNPYLFFEDSNTEKPEWAAWGLEFAKSLGFPVYKGTVGSIVPMFSHVRDQLKTSGFKRLMLYSTRPEVLPLIDNTTYVYRSKSHPSRSSEQIQKQDILSSYGVSEPYKLKWTQAVFGLMSSSAKQSSRGKLFRVDILRGVNDFKLVENFLEWVGSLNFLEDSDLKSLKKSLSFEGASAPEYYKMSFQKADVRRVKELLKQVGLSRELDHFGKNFRILKGIW